MKLVLEGEEVRRNYSLSALSDAGVYCISVKREAGGRVSNYLHDQVPVGATIDLFPPSGEFTLAASTARRVTRKTSSSVCNSTWASSTA